MIEQLKAKLAKLKAEEAAVRAERIKTEQEIVGLLADELKEHGTTNIHGLKIVTGYNRKWDQEQLAELVARQIPIKLFPFKTEYKEDRAKSKYIENNEPEVWAEIQKALTLTPKKPSVSIIEQKQEAA